MKLSILSPKSPIFSTVSHGQVIEKRKKPDLPKGGDTDAPANPVPDVAKDSPLSPPKGVPTPTDAAPSDMVKDIPQSIPTDAAAAASNTGKDSPVSLPKPAAAAASKLGKDIPTSVPKPGPTPTPAPGAPSTVTTTVTSTTTVYSSISTTTAHHTETKTVTGTGAGAVSATASAPSKPIHAGDSLSGAALTDAILAQCPKTTTTLTSTLSITPAPVTSMVTQTALSSASPITITMTSTVTPQADRAPTCSAFPEHREKAGPAEIVAIVFGLIGLALLVGMFVLARKCYQMRRAQRVWRMQIRNVENEMKGMSAGGSSGGAGVVVNAMAVHPARAAFGQRLKDQLAKSFERKEAWEK